MNWGCRHFWNRIEILLLSVGNKKNVKRLIEPRDEDLLRNEILSNMAGLPTLGIRLMVWAQLTHFQSFPAQEWGVKYDREKNSMSNSVSSIQQIYFPLSGMQFKN